MRRLLALTLLSCAAISALWASSPILVGHRGSGYGLENSEESFRFGANTGYRYLETDVKFTADSVLVCTHDNDTKRLGGTKELAASTFDELRSEPLIQKRRGLTYAGHLASMPEYLEICKETGAYPLIELKWTEGINPKDTSRIPMLIKQIDEAGMLDKCIILTSMKSCLEYIRSNWPDVKLQFLTGQYWANHFDWCAEWGIDVDIQAGYFDKATVDKFHDKGLQVNVWTVNTLGDYIKYTRMGCDFITTDRLDPDDLPQL